MRETGGNLYCSFAVQPWLLEPINTVIHFLQILLDILSGVQISFRRLTKVGATSKFWLKLTDIKGHCRKVGDLSTT